MAASRSFALLAPLLALASCLSRPVGVGEPTTKVNFTTKLGQRAVDKIDLLFMIDNSSSMGDKQAILADAIPVLLRRLVQPNCVSAEGAVVGRAEPTGTKAERFGCPEGSKPEFAPVVDIHVAVVSSSLGDFGASTVTVKMPDGSDSPIGVCPGTGRANDRAHLLRGGDAVPEAQPTGFLSWFPRGAEANAEKVADGLAPATPTETLDDLEGAFRKLVTSVGQTGCGLEAQLESVYRFLVQPDPWERVVVSGDRAHLEGLDTALLRQRAAFLRPDSLVVVVALTDEEDSSADPLALQGLGWGFMSTLFPGSDTARPEFGSTGPRPTRACASAPGSPECHTCIERGYESDPGCQPTTACTGDAGCPSGRYYPADEEDLNVRFHRMKQRFGIDPQYPLKRYTDGFTRERVPDRDHEHDVNGAYTGVATCVNPLFAARLPSGEGDSLCDLPLGPRTKDQIFFAVVGGAPQDLLHFAPGDPERSKLDANDWTRLVGADPARYDSSGQDPRMEQSTAPRIGRPGPGTDDPTRDWDTGKRDLQYACTFPLPASRECTRENAQTCDCFATDQTVARTPLCAPKPGVAGTYTQTHAKAYPTLREYALARSLGDSGIAASLCPIQLTDPSLATYGYNPAVEVVVDRLK